MVKKDSKSQGSTNFTQSKIQVCDHIIEAAKLGVWEWHADTNQVTFNDIVAKTLGYPPKDFLTMTLDQWHTYSHPDDTKTIKEKLAEMHKGKTESYHNVCRKKRKDDSYMWVRDEGIVLERDINGNPQKINGIFIDIDEAKKTELRLREEEQTLKTMIGNLPGIAYRCLYDKDWTMLFMSDAALELTGYRAEDFIGNRGIAYNDIIHWADQEKVNEVMNAIVKNQTRLQVEYRIVTKDRKVKWVWEQGVAVRNGDQDQIILEGIIIDITRQQKLAQQLELERQKLSRVVESSTDIIFEIDTRKRFISVYGKALDKLMMRTVDIIGKTVEEVFGKDGFEREQIYNRALQGESARYEWMYTTKETVIYFESTIAPIYRNKKVIGAVGITRDISMQKERIKEIEHLSMHDQLTGLYNRHYLYETIEKEIYRAHRYEEPLAMMVFDIDDFKRINDSFGHAIGDSALKDLAKNVDSAIRKSDTCFRIGGEEFMLIMPKTTLPQASVLAERIRWLISNKKNSEYDGYTCSFGIAELNQDETFSLWWKRADRAMYEAKEQGKNCVCLANNE